MSYHSKTAFFEFQSRRKFLNGLSDRSGSEEAERSYRSEATTLSGACAQGRSDKVERSHAQE